LDSRQENHAYTPEFLHMDYDWVSRLEFDNERCQGSESLYVVQPESVTFDRLGLRNKATAIGKSWPITR
jgi:hypothetical protein